MNSRGTRLPGSESLSPLMLAIVLASVQERL